MKLKKKRKKKEVREGHLNFKKSFCQWKLKVNLNYPQVTGQTDRPLVVDPRRTDYSYRVVELITTLKPLREVDSRIRTILKPEWEVTMDC